MALSQDPVWWWMWMVKKRRQIMMMKIPLNPIN